MATWVTHLMIADNVMKQCHKLDRRGFCVGNMAEGNNPAIISKEMYQAVQIEKQHRSNVIEGEEGRKQAKKQKIQFKEVNN